MVGRIIGLFSCLMCAVPFLMIFVYNKEMANLYGKCAIAFLVTGIGFAAFPIIGAILVGFDCSVGIYIAYRSYKRILKTYS